MNVCRYEERFLRPANITTYVFVVTTNKTSFLVMLIERASYFLPCICSLQRRY